MRQTPAVVDRAGGFAAAAVAVLVAGQFVPGTTMFVPVCSMFVFSVR